MQIHFGAITVANGKKEKIEAKTGQKMPFPIAWGKNLDDGHTVITGQDPHELTSVFRNSRNNKVEMIKLTEGDVAEFFKNLYGIFLPENGLLMTNYQEQWLLQLGSVFKVSKDSNSMSRSAGPSDLMDAIKKTFKAHEGTDSLSKFLHNRLQDYVKNRKTDAAGQPVQLINA